MPNQSVTVLNLATGQEQIYTNLTPLEALISAAITQDEPHNLTNTITRKRYAAAIIYGEISASIGDFAVKL